MSINRFGAFHFVLLTTCVETTFSGSISMSLSELLPSWYSGFLDGTWCMSTDLRQLDEESASIVEPAEPAESPSMVLLGGTKFTASTTTSYTLPLDARNDEEWGHRRLEAQHQHYHHQEQHGRPSATANLFASLFACGPLTSSSDVLYDVDASVSTVRVSHQQPPLQPQQHQQIDSTGTDRPCLAEQPYRYLIRLLPDKNHHRPQAHCTYDAVQNQPRVLRRTRSDTFSELPCIQPSPE